MSESLATNAKRDWLQSVFLLGGLVNACILIFTLGGTNKVLMDLYPGVFGPVGIVSVLLWGAAYIGTAPVYRQARFLVGVFAVEKFFYVGTWIYWLSLHGSELGEVYQQSLLAGMFYSVYGVVDLSFGLFFAWVALLHKPRA